MLIVLTEGTIEWDEQLCDFDWRRTDALPRNLQNIYSEVPKFLDLRWVRNADHLSLRNPAFRDKIADLAMILHGRPKDELIGEDIRQHRKVRRLAWSAAIGLILLTGLSIAGARIAWLQRNEAIRQREQAVARQVTLQARAVFDEALSAYDNAASAALTHSAVLAIEALRRWPSPEAVEIIGDILPMLPVKVETERLPQRSWQTANMGNDWTTIIDLVSMSADASRIVGVESGGELRAWEVDSWESSTPTDTAYRAIRLLALNTTGDRLATGSDDGEIRLWALPGWEVLRRWENASKGIALTISGDGGSVAVASEDGLTHVYRLDLDSPIAELVHEGFVERIALSHDGGLLASNTNVFRGGDNFVRVWRLGGEEEVAKFDVPGVRQLRFHPDGSTLVVPTMSETVLIDVPSGSMGVAPGVRRMVALNGDGSLMASNPGKATIVWDPSTWRRLAIAEHTDVVDLMGISGDGQRLVTIDENGNADVWDIRSARNQAQLGADGSGVSDATFSADGRWLATAHAEGRFARVRRVGNWKEVSTFDHDDWVQNVALSRDGDLLATLTFDGVLRVLQTRSHRELVRMRFESDDIAPRTDLALTDQWLALTQRNGIRVWRVGTWGDGQLLPLDEDVFPYGVALSPGGDRLAVVATNGEGRIWASDDWRELSRFALESMASIGFSGDGRRLAVGLFGSARVIDTDTGSEIIELEHWGVEQENVATVALSHDGEWLATGAGGTVQVWRLSSGDNVAGIALGGSPVSVAFAEEQGSLAMVAFDYSAYPTHGYAQAVPWRTDDLISAACARVTRGLGQAEWTRYFGADVEYRETCPAVTAARR